MGSRLSVIICTIAVSVFLCAPTVAFAESETADLPEAQATVEEATAEVQTEMFDASGDVEPVVQTTVEENQEYPDTSGEESGVAGPDESRIPTETGDATTTSQETAPDAHVDNTSANDIGSSNDTDSPNDNDPDVVNDANEAIGEADTGEAAEQVDPATDGAPSAQTPEGGETKQPSRESSEPVAASQPVVVAGTTGVSRASGGSNDYAKEDAMALASKGTLAKGTYVLVTKGNRTQVLQVAGASSANGRSTNIQAYAKGSKTQVWTFTFDSNGYATITNKLSGLVLSVRGNKAVTNATVVQAKKKNGKRGQLWIVTRNSDGSIRIASALDKGFSLDLKGAKAASGTVGVLAKGSSVRTQRWYALQSTPKVRKSDYVKPGWYSLTSKLSSTFNLFTNGNAASSTASFTLNKGLIKPGYAFKLVRIGNYYRIYSGSANGKAIMITGKSILPGARAAMDKKHDKSSLFSLQYDSASKGYTFVNVATGLTLAVTSGKAANNAKLSGQCAISGSKAQSFTLRPRAGIVCAGVYAIKSTLAGKRALTVSKSKGTFYSYRKDTSQKWYVAPVKGNVYIIESTVYGNRLSGASNKQLATNAAAETNKRQWWVPYVGPKGIIWKNYKTRKPISAVGVTCDEGSAAVNAYKGSDARQFTMATVPALESGVYEIRCGSNTGYGIEVKDSSGSAGAAVQIYGRTGSNNQRWIYDTKKHTLTNLNSGLRLEVKSTSSGSALKQAKAASKAAQKWTVQYAGGGKYRIVSGVNSQLVLTAAATKNGAKAKNSADTGSKLQKWKLTQSAFTVSPKGFKLIKSIVNNGHGPLKADYICIHETANPGATALNHRDLWRNDNYYSDYAVHYTLDWTGNCYYCVPEDRLCWQVGGGNSHVIGIELCHATNQSDFNKVWNAGVQWAVWQLKKHGWGINRLISHNECRIKWGGTDHTDPDDYFESYGKSWSQFKAAVKAKLLK